MKWSIIVDLLRVGDHERFDQFPMSKFLLGHWSKQGVIWSSYGDNPQNDIHIIANVSGSL